MVVMGTPIVLLPNSLLAPLVTSMAYNSQPLRPCAPRAEEWALDSANPADAELIDDAARHAEAVRTSVAGGDFRVNPQVPTCPSYCDFRHVCRVNQFTRSKWT